MRRPFPIAVSWLCLFVAVAFASSANCEEPAERRATRLRRELSSTRRVGYLRRKIDSVQAFVLKDKYDKRTYLIIEQPGLDLSAFVDRQISLYGETKDATADSQLRFTANRVTGLDDKQPVTGHATKTRASRTRPATIDADDARPITLANEASVDDSDVRLAALTDGLPSASEALEDIGSPLSIQIDTTGSDYVSGGFISDGYVVGPPVTGANWLRPTATPFSQMTGRWWTNVDYLLWRTDRVRLPALVTTSPMGTSQTDAGVLGATGTTVLNGASNDINNGWKSGGRIRGGYWWDEARTVGIEAEYMRLAEQSSTYQGTSTGDPILARPYFDALNGQEAAELIAFPNVIQGSIQTEALTNLSSGGIWVRYNPDGASGSCDTCSGRTIDWLVGYRSIRLEDDVLVRENTATLNLANPITSVVQDSFTTDNKFHGVELGAVYEGERGPWSIETSSKLAIGNNRQIADISGSSQITQLAVTQQLNGGLLAQRTNIGRYSRDELAFVPQLEVKLGWHVSPRVRLTAGYSFVYFSNVVRASDQISTDLNPNLIPPESNPFSGPLRPEFAWQQTDFWAHGLTLGADVNW